MKSVKVKTTGSTQRKGLIFTMNWKSGQNCFAGVMRDVLSLVAGEFDEDVLEAERARFLLARPALGERLGGDVRAGTQRHGDFIPPAHRAEAFRNIGRRRPVLETEEAHLPDRVLERVERFADAKAALDKNADFV